MGKNAYIVLMSDELDLAQTRSETDRTILVVDRSTATTENVRELIEFMDTPCVITAVPADWKKRLGQRRLEALFVGPELTDRQVASLLEDLCAMDPNVPVVMMQQSAS